MEHEFEKIRSKVLEAEQNPVAWEREVVWSKISQPERKTFAFYYAAASLLLASAIFFYAYESTKQREIELQLKAIELSIQKNKTYQATIEQRLSIKESIGCSEPVAKQETKQSDFPQQKIKKTKSKDTVAPIIEQPREEAMNNTIALTETPVIESETIVPVVENTVTKKIQAIIGSNVQRTSMIKDKKIKFRLLLPEENTETVPAAAETISFHSKIN